MPTASWQNQPPYSPSSDGGQDGSWFGGSSENQTGGEQNASWYPPAAPYAANGNGQQNGSWFSGQGSGGENGSGNGGSSTAATWIPLYGDSKGFAQFGRPTCTVG